MEGVASEGTVYELTGSLEAPTAILVHGLGLCRACWQWTLPALAGRYRVLTYDLYGHGDSPPPPETPSLGLFSRQLRAVMDHCGFRRAAMVGFSLGGMVVRRVAQDAPERVAALAILHSPHRRVPEAQAAILERVERAREVGPASTVDAALVRWFGEDCRATNPELMDLVRSWVMANDITVYHTVYRVLADGVDEIISPTPPIACPTLVMTGDEDFGNGPEMARAIAAEIEGAELCILPGLRHMALAEKPEAVNQPLVRFLDRQA